MANNMDDKNRIDQVVAGKPLGYDEVVNISIAADQVERTRRELRGAVSPKLGIFCILISLPALLAVVGIVIYALFAGTLSIKLVLFFAAIIFIADKLRK